MKRARRNLLIALILASLAAAAHADARLIVKLPGPSGTAAAFSRDGRVILTAGGNEARVWDAETYKPLTAPLRHGDGKTLTLAAFSPDGRRVLTAHGNEAWLWDVATGKHLHTLPHDARVYWADFSPDGHGWQVLTAGLDRKTRVWDRIDGRMVLELRHEKAPKFATFSPDGETILTLVLGELHVWDAQTGEELIRQPHNALDHSPGDRTRPVACSADGKIIVSALSGAAVVWSAEDGYVFGNVDTRPEALGSDIGPAKAVAVNPRGNQFAVAGHSGVCLFDVRDDGVLPSKTIRSLPARGAGDLFFSPHGTHLLVAGGLSGAEMWHVERGERVLTIQPQRISGGATVLGMRGGRAVEMMPGPLPSVAWSPDGRRVAAGFPSDGFASVWRVEPETEQSEHP